MSDSARIILVGNSTENLLKEIAEIRRWDNGHNYDIKAAIDNDLNYIMDSIDNVENAIKTDLSAYIDKNFKTKNKILKSGGNSDFFLVDDPVKAEDLTESKPLPWLIERSLFKGYEYLTISEDGKKNRPWKQEEVELIKKLLLTWKNQNN